MIESMQVHRSIRMNLNKTIRRNQVECLNFQYCSYCHKNFHTEEHCLEKKVDEHQKELYIQKSNIPKKYWSTSDPLKAFLMNNTIKGYRNRIYWENRNVDNKIEK
tara:strand:- start:1582 stop:1896 length:315 start_codon:yes stop_codon:yes gene_type:complete